MLIRSLSSCEEFIAGDNTILRELFHPDKHDVSFRYSFAHAIVKPSDISHVHSLATSELYYILEGKGIMHIDDEQQEVLPGDAVFIPPHAKQCIHNHGEHDLIFLCIVDPAWRKEDETIYSKS